MGLMGKNYTKPYACHMPCGTVIPGFDRRMTELSVQKLDTGNGLCEVNLTRQRS